MLALFDFDGTLTTKDSLPDFIKFAVGAPRYYLGLLQLSPILVAFKLKLIPNDIAKEKLIAHFFKCWDQDDFQHIADQYSIGCIDKITKPEAMKRISWHQTQGHKVVIVSASMECWLKKWCEREAIELIATRLETSEGKLTGRFAGKNCYGDEKVARIRLAIDLSEFDYVFAYGDSRGDKAMLQLADEQFYRYYK
ncbi:MAG: HAD family hydrolase [Mariprofundaceae bacterium]|nr:HAD family hydrolase [Mariprofundaceae bacterium]